MATFSDVHFEAEQETETHRTLENDHSVTEVELPGIVNLYLVIDGGRILFDQIKAPRVLEAIAAAKAAKASAPQDTTDTPPPPAEPAPEQV